MFAKSIVNQMQDFFEQLKDTDIQTLPNYQTMKNLARILNEKGMHPSIANRVCARIKIEISQNAIDSYKEEYHELVDNFATFLYRMYEVLKKDYPRNADEMFLDMASGFNFKLDF